MVKVPRGYRSRNVKRRSGGSSRGGGFGGLGQRSSGGSFGGGGGGLGGGGLGGALAGGAASSLGRRGGCGGKLALIALVVVAFIFISSLGGNGTTTPTTTNVTDEQAAADPCAGFTTEVLDACALANFVLDDVQDNFWVDEYPAVFGSPYQFSQLQLFENQVTTGGCGTATAAVGPFYCPADGFAYIDLVFMLRLQDQLGAEGDFAQAYILAHEVAHHVQNLAGINGTVRQLQSGLSTADSNALLVQLELQADCFAGAWARDADDRGGILDEGDLDEGVQAAGAVGDDAITGSTNQENFTHGSSAQRVEWFSRGFTDGASSCGTFNGELSP